MQIGMHFANFTMPGDPATTIGPALAATARAAEDVGCDWFTMMDHWFQMEQLGGPDLPMLEGYTGLGFVAGRTSRLTLGLLVTGVTYRHPGLLAKIVTTLDVVSEGRAMLGLGAAWYEREHEGLGVPFPPVAERFDRLEEALQICQQMWSDNDGPYEGKHYRLASTLNNPQSVQRPQPKILIGGIGERKTLRFVAKYADACNIFAMPHEAVAHKLEVLRRHCDNEGRDYATIKKTILGGDPVADPDKFLQDMERYAELGVDLVMVMPKGPDPEAYVRRTGETVISRLAEITAS